ALDDLADRHRLDAAGGEAEGDLLPEEGREPVADEPVEDAARLLRPHQAVVEGPGVLERALDGVAGDLVEDQALVGNLGLEQLQQVPTDRLALAVLVGGEEELVRIL